nr:type II toxin-antitoxin system HicA family toxin [Polycyclovorans algicola]
MTAGRAEKGRRKGTRIDLIRLTITIAFSAIVTDMNNRHRKTLAAVFASPTAKTLDWRAIEALLIANHCTVIEGDGSRVRFVKGDVVATFHRPHPAKEAKLYQVRDARLFLQQIGVTP